MTWRGNRDWESPQSLENRVSGSLRSDPYGASVSNFPGASREVAILELFSDWSGKLKKWDGK